MNYAKIEAEDVCNAQGVSVVLWVSGCDHKCYHCHNPELWDETYGKCFGRKENQILINELNKTFINNLVLSGGDPLYKSNLESIYILVRSIKYRFQESKKIWLYSGFTYEQILEDKYKKRILQYIDILIDGEFQEKLSSHTYPWAGSTNQRVIDVQKSLKSGEVILWDYK